MVAEILGKSDHRNVRIEELEEIPALTPASRTYEPYQHGEFARETAALADSILGPYGYHCSGEQYIISKDGGRMFGVRSYGHGARAHSVIDYTDSSTQGELKMQFAFANSTARSLRAKFGLGAQVMVCSNPQAYPWTAGVSRRKSDRGTAQSPPGIRRTVLHRRSLEKILPVRSNGPPATGGVVGAGDYFTGKIRENKKTLGKRR